jgi:hypothetical protein
MKKAFFRAVAIAAVMLLFVVGIGLAMQIDPNCHEWNNSSCRSSCYSINACSVYPYQCQWEQCNYQWGSCGALGEVMDCHTDTCTYYSSDCPCFGFC